MLVTRLALTLLTAGLLSLFPLAAQTPPAEGTASAVPGSSGAVPAATEGSNPNQQPEAAGATPQQQDPGMQESTAAALRSLAEVLKEKREARAAALAANDQNRAKELDQEIRQRRLEFASLVTRIDVKQFEDPSTVKFNLQEELIETVRPIVSVVKDWTAAPREAQQVKDDHASAIARRDIATRASQRLTAAMAKLKADATPESLLAAAEAQRELDEHWQPLLRSLGSQILVLGEKKDRLEQEASKTSLYDTLTTELDKGCSWWRSLRCACSAISS